MARSGGKNAKLFNDRFTAFADANIRKQQAWLRQEFETDVTDLHARVSFPIFPIPGLKRLYWEERIEPNAISKTATRPIATMATAERPCAARA